MSAARATMTLWEARSALTVSPVSSITSRQNRLIVSEPDRAWRAGIVHRLNELCCLPKGWDGYGAEPVSFETANFAVRMLDVVCPSEGPMPSAVPGPNRDLQVEWHLANGDIELHVRAPNDVHAWRLSADTGDDGEEHELTNDFTLVAQWIKDLSEPAFASQPAAA